ncbi:hypothetical protein B0H16DRAFT_1517497 [Mycena metata]|uniref:CRIB domain-containing protein n=1 Tax=Mycena metata TaxID=1033252 RepID=A0AAD7JRP0_9AGAR|nr:hypothetical protein B0H16DRAFT_1517497 [Mycena metata]
MSSHPSSQSLEEHSSGLLCSFHFELQWGFSIPRPWGKRRSKAAPPSYSKALESGEPETEVKVVWCGPVHVEEREAHIRSWFFKVDWLVLTDNHLALHESANKAPRTMILCSDIAHVDRAECEPCSIILQTKGKAKKVYLLSFRNDADLYGWQDAISSRMTGVSNPWNFQHNVHVALNPVDNSYIGLPHSWRLLPSTRPMPMNPPTNIDTDTRKLRIAINNFPTTGLVSTTLYVTPTTPLREVLERVCRKLKLEPEEYSLAFPAPMDLESFNMDDTVGDLKGRHHRLVLVTAKDRS